jgi:hypothetical protein
MEVVFGWFGKASGTMENMKYNIGVYELFVGYFPLHVIHMTTKLLLCVGNLVFHCFVFANQPTNVCN